MTPAERADVDSIDASRRTRIARGSGTDANEVTALVKQFKEMQRMMKSMGGFGTKRLRGKKKDKNRKGGGRVTPKGAAKVPKQPLALPGLDGSGFPGSGGPGGFPGLN
jgi:signal recognition particle subunit SRP54